MRDARRQRRGRDKRCRRHRSFRHERSRFGYFCGDARRGGLFDSHGWFDLFFGSRRRSRFGGLHQPRRRQRWRCRLGRLGLFQHRPSRLFAFCWRAFGKHVAAWQRDATLARETLHELARHHLLEGARCAPQVDAVRALQQGEHFLAARIEKFSDFVNANSCQRCSFDTCSDFELTRISARVSARAQPPRLRQPARRGPWR